MAQMLMALLFGGSFAIFIAGLCVYFYRLTKGVDMLKQLFEKKLIESIYTTPFQVESSFHEELHLKGPGNAEISYLLHEACDLDPHKENGEWDQEVMKYLEGYTGRQIAKFAKRLAQENPNMAYKVIVSEDRRFNWKVQLAS